VTFICWRKVSAKDLKIDIRKLKRNVSARIANIQYCTNVFQSPLLILALYLVDDTGSGDGENKASPSPPKSGVSLDVKARFASNIFRLSGMELGHVLQVIDLKCPNALEDPNPSHAEKDTYDEAQVEINIDAIDPRTFSELDRYVKDKMLARTTGEALDEMDDSPKKLKR
jgi:hypothetical protein